MRAAGRACSRSSGWRATRRAYRFMVDEARGARRDAALDGRTARAAEPRWQEAPTGCSRSRCGRGTPTSSTCPGTCRSRRWRRGLRRASSRCRAACRATRCVFVGYDEARLRAQGAAAGDRRARVRPAARARGARPAGGDRRSGTRIAARTRTTRRPSVLITRFLEASLPYRTLFMQQGLERYRERLLDAMAGLLVRLHLARLLLGRLLAVEHAVPPRRRRAAGLPGRRRDVRAARRRSRTGARATTSTSWRRTWPASWPTWRTWSSCRRRARRLRDGRAHPRALRAAVGRDHARGAAQARRALPHPRAHPRAQRPGLHGRRGRAAARAGDGRAPAPAHRSSPTATTTATCCTA